MIKKSAKIYLSGFLVGSLFCFFLIRTFPQVYLSFMGILIRKIESSVELGESFHLNISAVIILNNISASFIMAYGGNLLSRIYLIIGGDVMRAFYLFLYTFPVLILFFNGFVLGAFLLLYLVFFSESILKYLAALFPHGIFEIPGIILSGAIGLEIAELGKSDSLSKLKRQINDVTKGTLRRYAVVIVLLTIGGIMESSKI
ncbi:MAG: stage II sporulation protein M [Candidatus Hydrothermarchaeaceae archaeon]